MKKKEGKIRKFFRFNKGDIDIDTLVGIGIAIAFLVLLFLVIFVLKGNGTNIITQIKNLFRSG